MSDFHFLRPWAFLLLAMLPLVRGFAAGRIGLGDWRRIVDRPLLEYLAVDPRATELAGPLRTLLPLAWVLGVLALAGPSWDRQDLDLLSAQAHRVVVVDLSRSMLAEDVEPSRFERARFALNDLLDDQSEGTIGLVAFAGSAHIVTPLTDDAETVRNLLRSLHPDLMPVQGGRLSEGLARARDLLEGIAGQREILVVADDADEAAVGVASELLAEGIEVSVLPIGTAEPTPVRLGQGRVLKDARGQIVLPVLGEEVLRRVAAAGGGLYLEDAKGGAWANELRDYRGGEKRAEGAAWQDRGVYLIPLLLLVLAPLFRRGWLGLLLLAPLYGPMPAHASILEALTLNREQRAHALIESGRFAEAGALSEDPLRRGVAQYRAGDFAAAAQSFAQGDSVTAHYNRGNALARLGRYDEAIDAYDRVLGQDPGHEDAAFNKALLEQAQQEQQGQQGEESDESAESDESEGQDEAQAQTDTGEAQEGEEPPPSDLSESELTPEEQIALEQWLRRIPDDPGGLLRRKFLYEHRRRGAPPEEDKSW